MNIILYRAIINSLDKFHVASLVLGPSDQEHEDQIMMKLRRDVIEHLRSLPECSVANPLEQPYQEFMRKNNLRFPTAVASHFAPCSEIIVVFLGNSSNGGNGTRDEVRAITQMIEVIGRNGDGIHPTTDIIAIYNRTLYEIEESIPGGTDYVLGVQELEVLREEYRYAILWAKYEHELKNGDVLKELEYAIKSYRMHQIER